MTLSRLREPRGGGPNSELPTLPSLVSDSALVSTKRVPLSDAEWRLLRVHSTVQKFGAEETIIREGETNDALYLVIEGRALQIVEPHVARRASASSAVQVCRDAYDCVCRFILVLVAQANG